ncbi:hypothetical protein CH276_28010 [Rhodococcus sp. 06-470-2]|uniref:glycoside hydrolase family 19 protein n=1 Tax=unclassified Rhodococcus (in: high G+C Gram-positive bacteria) TaxID=192944 RepID=UPI000B9B0467|nr:MULTISPECIES: hypothetical protein [unclassified Rhodococcus (in: high G+C Gram-positive bacteria)]OZC55954.1 hypothetical protein CH276_28010 [Rhodococcus sp. 06-470-2]OZE64834.1 hypothetical protein CH265_10330 [Rhodococcus sp. 05-2221-1B]
MDAVTLAKAMDNRVSMARYEELAPAFNRALIQAGCNTVLRVTMWCSQIGHESGGLKWMEEIADGSAYEGRRDLGNTQPGDGKRFKGRGPIQVTGRNNYARLSAWAHSKGIVDTPTKFVDEPTLLSQPDFGFLGAVWYWTVARPQMNQLADDQLLVAATQAVNGGQNGIDDRRKFYYRALALGDALLPTPPKEVIDVSDASAVAGQFFGPDGKGFDILGHAVETDPARNRFLTEAVAVILTQLAGGPNFEGWEQLGDGKDSAVPRRTLVDGIAHVKRQNDEILALLKGGK